MVNLGSNRPKRGSYRWVGFALLSAVSITAMATCIRLVSTELPQSEIVFFRNFIGLLLLIPLAIRRKLPLRTNRLGLHVLRAGFGLCAMYLAFYAIAHLPLADAMLLNYTSPIFVSFFAFLLLREQLNSNRKLSIACGLIGVFCLFHPSSAIASIAGLLGLLSGVLAGLAQISIKKLSTTEPGLLIVMMYAIIGSIVSLVPMLFEYTAPDTRGWLLLLAIGCFGNLGQLDDPCLQAGTSLPGFTAGLFKPCIRGFNRFSVLA